MHSRQIKFTSKKWSRHCPCCCSQQLTSLSSVMSITQTPSDLSTMIDLIIIKAMETVWCCSPCPFQIDAIHHLCYPKHFQIPPSVLLVQGTSSGKSCRWSFPSSMAVLWLSCHCMPLLLIKRARSPLLAKMLAQFSPTTWMNFINKWYAHHP